MRFSGFIHRHLPTNVLLTKIEFYIIIQKTTEMKRMYYYVELPKLHVNIQHPEYANWGHKDIYEKELLMAINIEKANIEAKSIFLANKKFQFELVEKHLIPEDKKQELKDQFPRQLKLIEEIVHEIPV